MKYDVLLDPMRKKKKGKHILEAKIVGENPNKPERLI